MPGRRRIPAPDGQVHEGEIMPFRAGGEYWNEYMVDDGTVIKIKLVATEIIKLDDMYEPNTGDPVYVVQSMNVTSVQAPEHLKRQEGGEEQ
jgi:hypothetical protein